eukprot:GCRY01000426.1.p1 GENE.GCRY01000426.1~~GCRY01000426.1.p1  ORF type:complete len:248 (+),score=83.52 GCRY01000426.1:84-746(+)
MSSDDISDWENSDYEVDIDIEEDRWANEDKEEVVLKPKATVQTSGKPAGKKKKLEEKKKFESKVASKEQVDDTPLADPLAEKLRQQKLVEEADHKLTEDLFGVAPQQADEKSKEGIRAFGEKTGAKLAEIMKDSKHYIFFLEHVLRAASQNCSSVDTKALSTVMNVIHTERVKTEKGPAKKKATAKKKAVNVGMGDSDAFSGVSASAGADYPVEDDYDFM